MKKILLCLAFFATCYAYAENVKLSCGVIVGTINKEGSGMSDNEWDDYIQDLERMYCNDKALTFKSHGDSFISVP